MMHLRLVATVHFGKSELTHLQEILKARPELAKPGSQLRLNDVILLISKLGNQLIFLHDMTQLDDGWVVRSTRLRLTERTPWNPSMLSTYAADVGLKLGGLRTFEDHLKAQAVAREAQRAQARRPAR